MNDNRERFIAENSEYNFNEDLVTFTLIDEATLARREREGDIRLPAKKIDVQKDERWNTKQMNSKLLAGILNGDSVDRIAHSLVDVIGNNKSSQMRNARTMVTQAECGGRQDSYESLAAQGVAMKKVWIATPDDRTRESHLEIDGEEVDIDADFSNGLEYPADPSGEPEEVWNCRCSMRTHIVGFKRADGTIARVDYERDKTMHEVQMQDMLEQKRADAVADANAYYHSKFGKGTIIDEDADTRIVRFDDGKERKIAIKFEDNFRLTEDEYKEQFGIVDKQKKEEKKEPKAGTIIENHGFTDKQKDEFFNGDGYLRFGAYSPDERSLDFTRMTFEQNEDVTDILEHTPDKLEEKVNFMIDNYKAWRGMSYDDLFEEGVSVFKTEDGKPILENLTQAQSMAIRLDKDMYAVDGKVIGKGHDGEPLLKDTVNMQVAFDREQMENIIIDTLKENFDVVEGTIEHGGNAINSFYDWETGKREFTYCGLTFKEPKSAEWEKLL